MQTLWSEAMTQAKYFQKLKCECFKGLDRDTYKRCYDCKGSGIIAGVDITSTINTEDV